MSVIERLLRRDDGATFALGGVVIEPMQRRDLRRGVMYIPSSTVVQYDPTNGTLSSGDIVRFND